MRGEALASSGWGRNGAHRRAMAERFHDTEKQGRVAMPRPEHGARGRRSFKSSDILAGAREVIIEHDGECYRLRLTSKGKLILTK